jgi:hypothetical protein
MELLLLIEIVLLVLFILLGIRLIGKILGVIFALISWLIVGALVLGFFIYPDYKNYKDPYVYLKCDNNLDKQLPPFLGQTLKKYTSAPVRNGTSPGKVYIDCIYALKNINLLKSEDNTTQKLIFILKGYKQGKVEFDPKLKNEELFNITADIVLYFLDNQKEENNNKQQNKTLLPYLQ